jgi:predicted nucleic acid-binding protein
MNAHYYIDTCSLKWRYLRGKPTADVDRLMNDTNNTVLTAELTILEWSSALARVYRRGSIDRDTFKRNEIAFMTDIFIGRLEILPPLPRAIERARYLIEYVGVDNRLNLGSGDSIQLISALDAATRLVGRLTFVTSNHRLANIVESIDITQQYLDLMYLDPR